MATTIFFLILFIIAWVTKSLANWRYFDILRQKKISPSSQDEIQIFRIWGPHPYKLKRLAYILMSFSLVRVMISLYFNDILKFFTKLNFLFQNKWTIFTSIVPCKQL